MSRTQGGHGGGQEWVAAYGPACTSAAPARGRSVTADVQSIVVGAGAVGLAVGRALATAGQEVMLLEQHALIGSETSSRNSEVIHAGIYYPPGSLRASLCVRGKELLYA